MGVGFHYIDESRALTCSSEEKSVPLFFYGDLLYVSPLFVVLLVIKL